MNKLILIPFIAFLFSFQSLSAQKSEVRKEALEWHTDLMKANALSQKTHKPIFAFFTGSDWCGWCRKLQHDVFSKPEFIQWAQKNVILLELDFPRGKKLPPELSKQNTDLQQTFQVQGFPTIWLFFMAKDEATGKFNISALGNLGYPPDAEQGKEEVKFLATAKEILTHSKSKANP